MWNLVLLGFQYFGALMRFYFGRDSKSKLFAAAVITFFVSRDLWAAVKIFRAQNANSVSFYWGTSSKSPGLKLGSNWIRPRLNTTELNDMLDDKLKTRFIEDSG